MIKLGSIKNQKLAREMMRVMNKEYSLSFSVGFEKGKSVLEVYGEVPNERVWMKVWGKKLE